MKYLKLGNILSLDVGIQKWRSPKYKFDIFKIHLGRSSYISPNKKVIKFTFLIMSLGFIITYYYGNPRNI